MLRTRRGFDPATGLPPPPNINVDLDATLSSKTGTSATPSPCLSPDLRLEPAWFSEPEDEPPQLPEWLEDLHISPNSTPSVLSFGSALGFLELPGQEGDDERVLPWRVLSGPPMSKGWKKLCRVVQSGLAGLLTATSPSQASWMDQYQIFLHTWSRLHHNQVGAPSQRQPLQVDIGRTHLRLHPEDVPCHSILRRRWW